MRRKHNQREEIVAKLRQVDVLTSQGISAADAIRAIGVTEVTYYRWRHEFGGLRSDQVKLMNTHELTVSAPASNGITTKDLLRSRDWLSSERVGYRRIRLLFRPRHDGGSCRLVPFALALRGVINSSPIGSWMDSTDPRILPLFLVGDLRTVSRSYFHADQQFDAGVERWRQRRTRLFCRDRKLRPLLPEPRQGRPAQLACDRCRRWRAGRPARS
jgi:putative transposase